MTASAGIYISVPFCKAKCTFCNFASDVFAPERMQLYVHRLCEEIRLSRTAVEKKQAVLPPTIDTIYFGGGTPSLLSAAHFRQIFHQLRSQFTITPNAEITLECAPGQLSGETLAELLRHNLNRISFGIQSFIDKETAAVGRLHTRLQCEAEIARVRAAGVTEINIDLIAGLPHQTAASWHSSIEQAIAIAVPHLSVYMLEVDDDSRLGYELLQQGTRYHASAVPAEDDTADWYQQACTLFAAAGLPQYEISNFARPNHASRHNLKYWHRHPYLGLGLDAHSMLNTSTGAIRFANTSNLDEYLNPSEPSPLKLIGRRTEAFEADIIGLPQAFEESLFLGLRLNEGVDLHHLRSHFGEPMLNTAMPALLEVRDAGLLELTSSRIRLTANGRLASNEVFSRLLIDPAA
jgi:oxygen-independent coproporphyrinogen-3 oxidase